MSLVDKDMLALAARNFGKTELTFKLAEDYAKLVTDQSFTPEELRFFEKINAELETHGYILKESTQQLHNVIYYDYTTGRLLYGKYLSKPVCLGVYEDIGNEEWYANPEVLDITPTTSLNNVINFIINVFKTPGASDEV